MMLGAARAKAETGDHFVEDEQCANAVALGTQAVEEAINRRNDAHVCGHWFDNNGGDLIVELRHHVVWRNDGVGNGGVGDASSAGQAKRGQTAAAGHKQRVGGAVKVARERDDAVASGGPASKTNGRAGGFGAAVHQPHSFATWHSLADGLGQFHLARCGRSERGAIGGRSGDGRGDSRVPMTHDDSAVALHEIDVARALNIEHVWTLGASNDVWGSADGLERAD